MLTEKTALDCKDIAERYGIGRDKAYKLMRQIAYVNGGAAIPGKLLLSEIEFFEASRGRRPGEIAPPTEEKIQNWTIQQMMEARRQ